MQKLYGVLNYAIGLIILSLGITFIIRSTLGAAAWDALMVGLANKTNLTMGTWVIIVGILLLILNAILLRTRPDIPALFTVFILGSGIDLWFKIIPTISMLLIQIILFSMGLLLTAIGIALYTQSKFAVAPVDRLMFVLSKVTGLSIRMSRITTEACVLILAFILQGPIGIGTLLVTFLLGPMIQYFMTHLHFLGIKKNSAT